MMTADLHSKCDTCGQEAELFVYALPGVPMSVANCQVCTDWNCYPWSVLVGNTVAIGGTMEHAADWWLDAVTVSCARLGKTRREFADAVVEALEATNEKGADE